MLEYSAMEIPQSSKVHRLDEISIFPLTDFYDFPKPKIKKEA